MGHSYAMAYDRNYIHMSLGWQAVSVTILPRWCPGARWCPVVPWCPGALVPSPALALPRLAATRGPSRIAGPGVVP